LDDECSEDTGEKKKRKRKVLQYKTVVYDAVNGGEKRINPGWEQRAERQKVGENNGEVRSRLRFDKITNVACEGEPGSGNKRYSNGTYCWKLARTYVQGPWRGLRRGDQQKRQ